jgi:hypothetical protein
VEVLLDPDHVQAVLERLRRVAVCDPARDLVRGEEAEPDRQLATEICVAAWEDAAAG